MAEVGASAESAQRRGGVVAGAVLVGGASRRMGTDKSLLEVDGIAMVDRTASTLQTAGCAPVVAVGPLRLSGGVRHIEDRHPGEGPLGAILTALAHVAPVLVVACDLPSLDAGVVEQLLDADRRAPEHVDVVVARSDGIEPLFALWRPSAAAPLQRAFDGGERAVHRAMAALMVIEVPVPSSSVRNVNEPSDLETE